MSERSWRRFSGLALALAVCAGVAFTGGCTRAPRSQAPGHLDLPEPASIGVARMDADGTIILDLRATADGIVGDAQLRYSKDHPEYDAVLTHLGGLRPGETKPVPPWPDPGADGAPM
jgi:hypothetical protein